MPVSRQSYPTTKSVDETHSLRINLVDIGQSLRENIAGHLVAELVSEFGRLSTGPVNRCSGICYGTGHDAADVWRQFEDMGDGRRVDQFILSVLDSGSDHAGRGESLQGLSSETAPRRSSFPSRRGR